MEQIEITKVIEGCQIIGNSIKVPKAKDIEVRNKVFKMLEDLDGVWQGGLSMEIKYKEDPTVKFLALINHPNPEVKSTVQCCECEQFIIYSDLYGMLTVPLTTRMCNACNDLLDDITLPDIKEKKKHDETLSCSPDQLATKMVSLAKIDEFDMICEPSAGRGNIVKAIVKAHPKVSVFCYELLPANQKYLVKNPKVVFVRPNFLDPNFPWERFDKIIAFPPLEEDTYHIREMYARLEVGGTIVTVASKIWQTSKEHKHTAFKNWLEDKNANVMDISPEELSEIGVTTPFVIIVIKK